jgi:hypothetical protein
MKRYTLLHLLAAIAILPPIIGWLGPPAFRVIRRLATQYNASPATPQIPLGTPPGIQGVHVLPPGAKSAEAEQ